MDKYRKLVVETEAVLPEIIIQMRQEGNFSPQEIEEFKDYFVKTRRERRMAQMKYYNISFDESESHSREQLLNEIDSNPNCTAEFKERFFEWYDGEVAKRSAASKQEQSSELPAKLEKYKKQAKFGVPLSRILQMAEMSQSATSEEMERFKSWYNNEFLAKQDCEWEQYKKMAKQGVPFGAIVQIMGSRDEPEKHKTEFSSWYTNEYLNANGNSSEPPADAAVTKAPEPVCPWEKYKKLAERQLPFPAILQKMSIDKHLPDNSVDEFTNWFKETYPDSRFVQESSTTTPAAVKIAKTATKAGFAQFARYEKSAKAGVPLHSITVTMKAQGCSADEIKEFSELFNEKYGKSTNKSDVQHTGNEMKLPSDKEVLQYVATELGMKPNLRNGMSIRDFRDEFMIDAKLEYVKFTSSPSAPPEEDPLDFANEAMKNILKNRRGKLVTESLVDTLFQVSDSSFKPQLSESQTSSETEFDPVVDLVLFSNQISHLLNPEQANAMQLSCKFAIGMQLHHADCAKQARMFQNVLLYHVVKCNTQVFLPLRTTTGNYFGLLVRPSTSKGAKYLDVAVCSKRNIDYHPHTVSSTTSALLMCPIFLLRDVEAARVLSDSFAVTLAQICSDETTKSSSRYVYEVLLCFLARCRTVHDYDDQLFKNPIGIPGLWMSKAPSQSDGTISTHVNSVLLSMRYSCKSKSEWKCLKLKILSCFVTQSPMAKMLLKFSMCFSKHQNLLDESERRKCEDIIKELSNVSSTLTQDAADDMENASTISQESLPRYSNDFNLLLDDVMTNEATVANMRLADRKDHASETFDSHNDIVDTARVELLVNRGNLSPTKDNLHLLRVLTDYWNEIGQSRACIATVQHACVKRFPMDPKDWETEPSNSAVQLDILDDLLRIAFNLINSCFAVQSELTGHHAILFTHLYVVANAIMRTPGSTNKLAQILSEKNLALNLENVNGVHYNIATSSIPLDADLVELRYQTLRYTQELSSRDSTKDTLHMWSFSKAPPDATFAVVAELKGVDSKSPLLPGFFGSDFTDCDCPHFARLRDLAFLAQYCCVPLREEGVTGESNRIPWAEGTPSFFAGEEYIMYKLVIHTDPEHPNFGYPRSYQTAARAVKYFPKRTPISENSDEKVIASLHSLPNFSRQLTDEDAERVLSFLTAPYIRIPSLLAFFCESGNEAYMFHEPLRKLVIGSILEPFESSTLPKQGETKFAIPENAFTHLPMKSILCCELNDPNSPTLSLFLKLFKSILEQCTSSVLASIQMVETVAEFAYVGSVIESYNGLIGDFTCNELGTFLRGPCLTFLLEHKEYGGCVVCYLFASDEELQQAHTRENVLKWATHLNQSSSSDLYRIPAQTFLIRNAWCLSEDLLSTEHQLEPVLCASGLTITDPAQYIRNPRTGVYSYNLFRFDPLLAQGFLLGGSQVDELPKYVIEMDSELKVSSRDKIFELKNDLLNDFPTVSQCFVIEQPSRVLHLCVHGDIPLQPGSVRDETYVSKGPGFLTCVATTKLMDQLVYLEEKVLESHLPRYFMEHNLFWFSVGTRKVLSTPKATVQANHQIVISQTETSNNVWEVRRGDEVLVRNPAWDLAVHFDTFEDPNFVLFWKSFDQTEERLSIELPRYNLLFIANQEGSIVPSQNLQLRVKRECVPIGNSITCKNNGENGQLVAKPHCLRGIDKYLLLVNDQDQDCVMLPHLARNKIEGELSQRAKVYLLLISPLETSFFNLTTESSVTLFHAKLVAKMYYDAFNAVDSCATSSKFPSNIEEIVQDLCFEDSSLEACACRLKFYQATFLRNGTDLPKGSHFSNDLDTYVTNMHKLPRTMVLSPYTIRELIEYSLGLGMKEHSLKRMAPSTNGEADKSTLVSVTRSKAHLSLLMKRYYPHVEQVPTLPKAVACHAGGGFQSIQKTAIEAFDDVQLGGFNTYVPQLQTKVVLDCRSLESINDFMLQAVKAFTPDFSLVSLVEALRSPLDQRSPERSFAVQLLSLRLYLQKQAIQGTIVWESTTFYMLSVLGTGVLLTNEKLSEIPSHQREQRSYLNAALRVCKRLRDTPGFAYQCRPVDISSMTPIEERERSGLSRFDDTFEGAIVYPKSSSLSSKESRKPLFEDSAFFQTLVVPVTSSKVLSVPTSEESEGERILFDLLREGEETKACLDYISRIEGDVSYFDSHEVVTKFQLTSDGISSFEFALDQLDAEKAKVSSAILKFRSTLEHAANDTQDWLLQVCNRAPLLSVDDVIRLGVNGNACEVLGKEVTDMITSLLLQCTKLQQLGLVKASLRSLIAAMKSDAPLDMISVEKDVLMERLLVSRVHTDSLLLLCFEFEAGYLLREPQISLVETCIERNREELCGCQQMKMGDGKSSTIIPLLSVMLHELEPKQKTMVIVVVPPPLLEMEEGMIMRTTSRLFKRQIVHFDFKRDTVPEDPDLALPRVAKLRHTLEFARDTGTIVLTTASSLKAYLLRFVEMTMYHDKLASPDAESSNTAFSASGVGAVVSNMRYTMDLFAHSRLLLDECDVSFHPLRSELNYPVGVKKPLMNEKWRVGAGTSILSQLFSKDLEPVLAAGLCNKMVQDQPHLVLVEPQYYFESIMPVLSQGLATWVLDQIDHPDANLERVVDIVAATTPKVLKQPKNNIVISANKTMDKHPVENLLTDKSVFWCSTEYPEECDITIAIPAAKKLYVGALEIRFKLYSTFFGKSGLSMLPSSIAVEFSFDSGKTFVEKFRVGEFAHRKLYIENAKHGDPFPTHVRVILRGQARWFGVERLELFEREFVDPAGLVPHTSPERRSHLASALIESNSELRHEAARIHCAVSKSNMRIVDIAHDYLTTFLPHAIGKVNTVHYGLVQRGLEREFGSRKYLAVPFVGKDTPSPASEFSHPDVLILLTLLSYRYSGLRKRDVFELVQQLQMQLRSEPGPTTKRKAYVTFSRILSHAEVHHTDGLTPNEFSDGEAVVSNEPVSGVLPLHLFNVDDNDAVTALWQAIRHVPEAVEYYCKEIAFVRCLAQRAFKLTATGEDLVLLCGRSCFGFSGTPNASLPLRFETLEWEKGTEGQFLRQLGREQFVRANPPYEQSVEKPTDLLRGIANSNCCALIDCGALITGLSNQQVAEYLLTHGLGNMLGVVFLDEFDQKLILQRGSKNESFEVVPLHLSPIPEAKRFTFYDQVHTVGMDIKQPPSGTAVVTVNKDMIFRDFAQACYRMRRLGKGQSLQVLYPDTVHKLMERVVPSLLKLPVQRLQYLLLRNTVESMRGELELLAQQNLSYLWRNALLRKRVESGNVARSQICFETKLAPKEFEDVFVVETQTEDTVSSSSMLAKFSKYLNDAEQEASKKILSRYQTTSRADIPQEKKGPKYGLLKFLSKRFRRRKHALESHSQEIVSHDVSKGGTPRGGMALTGEQQQQKEKEQQVDFGEYKDAQPRSWVLDKDDGTTWTVKDNELHGLEEHFQKLRTIGIRGVQNAPSETKDDVMDQVTLDISEADKIMVSSKHTCRAPTISSRLLNVEYVLHDRTTRTLYVITLEEASTVRYHMQFDSKFIGRYQLLGVGHQHVIDLFCPTMIVENPIGGLLYLLRFFNVNKDFEVSQVNELKKILSSISAHDRHMYYLNMKRGRRRNAEPGFETSTDSNLRSLFQY